MATQTEIEKLERRWQENPLGLTFATLAEAYRKGGDIGRALEVLELGLAQHPNYVPAHIVRGRCHFDGQANGDAEAAFQRVLELDRENVIALKGLAELSEREGRLPEAMQRLSMLLEVDRNNEEARGQLDRVAELLAGQVDRPNSEAPVAQPEAVEPPVSTWAPEPPVVVEVVVEVVVNEVPVIGSEAVPPPGAEDNQSFEQIATLDAEELRPSGASEFQLDSDAETLGPTAERMIGILLSSDAPILEAGLGSVDGLLGGDYASLIAFEPGSEPGAEVIAQFEPEPEPAPIVAEIDAPIIEVVAPPEPIQELVPEPEPEPEPEPVAAAAEPELMVTETMAEIFLRQGHQELALAVYQQLALRDPSNERVAGAVARLTPAAKAPEPEPEPIPVRVHSAAETGGRSVAALLGAVFHAMRPTVAAAVHPPAFEVLRRAGGEPTRPAEDTLSLGTVFGDETGPAGPASPLRTGSGSEPSFEEFFAPATGSSADAELPKPPAEPGAVSAEVPEDLEQFNAWLRGLKR